jgi:hypothetical protein
MEASGSWRRLHDEELHSAYASPNIVSVINSRRRRFAGHVARMIEKRNAYMSSVGKHEGKIPVGRRWRRWEDNIRMDLRETGLEFVD